MSIKEAPGRVKGKKGVILKDQSILGPTLNRLLFLNRGLPAGSPWSGRPLEYTNPVLVFEGTGKRGNSLLFLDICDGPY